MLVIRKILFATDFSDCALQALGHAVHWARRFRADLDVLHVIEDVDADPSAEEEARRSIEKILLAHGAEDLPGIRSALPDAAPAWAVAGYARDESVDLIVMGTHGRTAYGAMLLGGVTAEVIREAPCPVLAIRQSQRPAVPGAVERIVVPVDLSTWSGLAVRYAKEIAVEDESTVLLLHVIEEPVSPDFYYALGGEAALDPRVIGAWAGKELERLFHDAPGGDVPFEAHVLRGHTAMEIPAFAARKGADLLVMPTHGASAREEPVLGSVTEQVLRRAPCPLLAIKPFGRQPLAERHAGAAVASTVDEIC